MNIQKKEIDISDFTVFKKKSWTFISKQGKNKKAKKANIKKFE